MKIVKLTWLGVESAKAQVYASKKNNTMYFNIKHGSSGRQFGYWLGRVSHKVGVPNSIGDELILDKDNYVLISTLNKDTNEVSIDKLGNVIYTIGVDYSTIHNKDLIVLWEIPNKNYTKVDYTVNGDVNIIGKATSGKDRGNKMYKSPAPVLEIYGDCELRWTAVNNSNEVIEQKVFYDYANSSWDISPINKTKE